jgi:hypothetical protein
MKSFGMVADRYAPELAFPRYAFVPGRHPHPVTDPRGHSFDSPRADVAALNPKSPMSSQEFLHAIDLFNAGFYWEAHEAWEELWIASGRTGEIADFLKGLIKLAAAGVKSREGSATGVQRHARRATELFEAIRLSAGTENDRFAGLSISQLVQMAKELFEQPFVDVTPSVTGLPVLPCQLMLTAK